MDACVGFSNSWDSALLCAAVNETTDGILAVDKQGTVQFANPAAERLFGYRAGEILGRKVSELLPKLGDAPPYSEVLLTHSGKGKTVSDFLALEARRKDGAVFSCMLRLSQVEAGHERLYLGIVQDFVDERHEPEVTVPTRRGHLREGNHALPSSIDRLEQLTTAGHAQSPSGGNLVDQRRMPTIAGPGTGDGGETDPFCSAQADRDFTGQEAKADRIGGLAAAMAHEINNPLSAILQSCQNISRRLSPQLAANARVAEEVGADLAALHVYLARRGVFDFVQAIQDGATRAARIVEDMLKFSRDNTNCWAGTPIEGILETALRVEQVNRPEGGSLGARYIEVERDYDPTVGEIFCDRIALEQVFLNLITNARYALCHSHKPSPYRIAVRTRRLDTGIQVEVEDNGPGMDVATKQRIFKPFYTTKPVGAGTGLGLSIAQFIVTQRHGGTLEVVTSLGQGTRFIVRLPRHPQHRNRSVV